jgi:hypothetical protein
VNSFVIKRLRPNYWSKAFHEKAGLSQAGFMVLVEWSSMELIRLCRHPSIRTFRGAMVRSGASWAFSFQQVLLPENRPWLPAYTGSWAGTWPQSPELGGSARRFQFRSTPPRLRPRWNCAMARRPHRSPTTCEAVRQLSSDSNDRAFLGIASSPLGEFQSPSPQITVLPERPQNVVRALHHQGSQVTISFLVI